MKRQTIVFSSIKIIYFVEWQMNEWMHSRDKTPSRSLDFFSLYKFFTFYYNTHTVTVSNRFTFRTLYKYENQISQITFRVCFFHVFIYPLHPTNICLVYDLLTWFANKKNTKFQRLFIWETRRVKEEK